MPKAGKNGASFASPYELMSYIKYMYEVDIEYIYFLITHNEDVKTGRITVVNDEAIATAKVATMASDLELRYHLFSESSVTAQDKELLCDIAITYGVKNVRTLGINLKNRIYELVTAGDNGSHRFINTKSFMELIGNEEKRKIAKIIYNSVEKGDIQFSNKDYGWHFVEGGQIKPEIIFSVAGKDSTSAVQYLINECTLNDKTRQDIYGYLGVKSNFMIEEYRDRTIVELREICRKREVPIANLMSRSKESLIEALCSFKGVAYEKPTI